MHKAFAGWSSMPADLTEDARPEPGPESPNCVSTEADSGARGHHVAPVALPPGMPVAAALDWLAAVIGATPGAEASTRGPVRLRAVARTRLFRFVDDVEARVDVAAGALHLRSASRIGHGDLGANRRRVRRCPRSLADAWSVTWSQR